MLLTKDGQICRINDKGEAWLKKIGYPCQESDEPTNYSDLLKNICLKTRKVKTIEGKINNISESPGKEFEEEILLEISENKLWYRIQARKQDDYVIILKEDITEKKEMEKEIEEKDKLLESVLSCVPDVINIQKPDHTIIHCNRAGYEKLNLFSEKIPGQKCYEILGEEEVCENCATEKALKTKKLEEVEKYIPELDIYIHSRSKPIINEDEEVELIIEQLQDVTEERMAKLKADALFANSTSAIVMLDSDGKIVNINKEFKETFGYSFSEVMGEHLDDIMEWGREGFANRETTDEILRGKKLTAEATRYDRWDNPKEFIYHGIPIEIEDKVEGAYVMYDEITKLKREKEMLEAIFEASQDVAFVITGAEEERKIDLIKEFSPGAENLFGYDRDEVIDEPVSILHPSEDVEIITEIDQHLAEGKRWNNKIEVVRKNGERFPALFTVYPYRSKFGNNRDLAVYIDITEQEEARKKLEEAKKKAEKASRAKSEFLANMSHEIRTPMNAITGLSELCLNEELTEEKRCEYLNRISASSEYLLTIINDILDLSKIEEEKIELKESVFDLDEVLEQTWLIVAERAKKKPIEVLFSRPPSIPNKLVGDKNRLTQILTNLTKNSINYTDSGEVVIKVKMKEQDEGRVIYQFAIEDTGQGIPPEKQGEIFERFSRAEKSTLAGKGGAGLGLTISRELVEMMDGEIWLESEVGEGSTFFFTAEFGLTKEEDEVISAPPKLEDLKVLVVDDNSSARRISEEYLKAFGFQPEVVAEGKRAIKELIKADQEENEDNYKLVLMDWKLPGQNGLGITKKIMENLELEVKPKIILVSAYEKEEIMREPGFEYVSYFLTKPFSPSSLFDAVMDVFGYSGRDIAKEQEQELTERELMAVNNNSILLVEDNVTNQILAREILESYDYEVDIAEDGIEALDKVESKQYDCVLMDIQLPVLDGYEATRKIRDELKLADLPIIALTASVMDKHYEKAKEAGMDDLIAKPIDIESMLTKIKEMIINSKGKTKVKTESESRLQSDKENEDEDTEKEIKELSDLKTINVEDGLNRLRGNIEAYRRILKGFAQNQTGLKERIEQAQQKSDFEKMKSIAHEIKGSAGNIGAEELHKKAADLEKTLSQREKSFTEEEIKQIEKMTEELEQELSRTAAEIMSMIC